jgi:hypothetical protein
MFTPLLDKLAEPSPPEGVSVEAWDKILEKGPSKMPKTADVDFIRKTAERVAFEELVSPEPSSNPEWNVISLKQGSVADPELWKTAALLAQKATADGISCSHSDIYDVYEELGGTYKHAFGAQMFDMKQMAGSPAVSGGMAARATTRTPQVQSQPVSVTTTTLGQNMQQGGASAAGGSSAPSTPSAPTG